jgi:two-component system cell cycle response regulator
MPPRILVIEDNPANLELMVCLLEAYGYSPLTAEDGEAGLAAIEREHPELVLCDIQMPKLNGYELAQRMKANPLWRKIPLVAVSALAMVGDKERGLNAGFDGYISKPIETRTFVAEVEAYLGIKRTLQPVMAPIVMAKEKPAAKRNLKMLAVDDLTANLALMDSLFGPLGYKVTQASGLAEALSFAQQSEPDIVVSDVSMSDGSGYDLCQAFKADPRLRQVPIILITSTDCDEVSRRKGLAAGATRYLFRPIDSASLAAEVEACLSSRG